MAIIIKSNSIYKKSNDKIIKNHIDQISLTQSTAKSVWDYDVGVFETKKSITKGSTTTSSFSKHRDAIRFDRLQGDGYVYYANTAVGVSYSYFPNLSVPFPKVLKNKYIRSLSFDNDGEPKFDVSITYKKYVGTAEMTGLYDSYEVSLTYPQEYVEEQGSLPNFEVEITKKNDYVTSVTSTSKISIDPYLSVVATMSETDDYYTVKINRIICGQERYSVSTQGRMTLTEWDGTELKQFKLTGECIKYEPIYLTVTYMGNTFGIELSEVKKNIGDGNSPFSVDGNELLQDGTTNNKKEISEHIAEEIFSSYRSGKETATILCSISDYYDEKGVLKISSKKGKMSFHIGDQVIPMVFGADGRDRPMSRYNDGSPKVFNVVGRKMIYDGAVWQELTLQEKTQGV